MTAFIDRLKEIMPKRPEPKPDTKAAIFFQASPIRCAADSFAAHMESIPANEYEFRAALWVFGEIICGDMEKRMNHALQIANDAINCKPMPTIVVPLPESSSEE